jgi:D-amino-acid dehydrogenase
MELSGINHTINMNRISPIIHAANEYFPSLNLAIPNKKDIWSGLRPLSPDGLPYIGRTHELNNFLIATGHAMIGISLCAATGWLISQLAEGNTVPLDMKPFHPDRFK